MADRVEREVLRLTTESAQFFSDLDRAIRQGDNLTDAFKRSKAGAASLSKEWKEFSRALDSTKSPMDRFSGGLNGSLGLVKNFAGALGIGLGAGAVVAFGKHVLQTASEIKDLSEQLGFSYENTQRFKFAAEQTGAELTNVKVAAGFLNKTLGIGEDSTQKLIKDIGLDFKKLSQESPDQIFLDVTGAIKKIPDPLKQTEAAVKLLGKSGGELLPAIREGFADLANSASTMSDSTIERLADAEDAWAKFTTNVTIWSGEALAAAMRDAEAATKGWSRFFGDLKAAGSGALSGFQAGGFGGAIAGASAAHQQYLGVIGKENTAEKEAAAAKETSAKATKGKTDRIVELTNAEKAYQKQIQEGADQLTGKKLQQDADLLARQVLRAGGAAKITGPELKKLRGELNDLWELGAKLDPVLEKIRTSGFVDFNAAAAPWVKDVTAMFDAARGQIGLVFFQEKPDPEFAEVARIMADLMNAKPEVDYTIDFGFTDEERWNNFNKWMQELTAGVTADHPVLEVFRTVATEFPKKLGSALLHGQSIKAAFAALAVDFGNQLGREFGESLAKEGSKAQQLLGDIFGFGGSLIGWGLGKLIGAGSNKTKHEREDFAKEQGFGSLDALFDSLRKQGEKGQALVNEALNLIGKKDFDRNAKWMERVLDLLDEQKDAADELNVTWEEAVALAQELGVEMSALGKGTQQSSLDALVGKRLVQMRQLLSVGASSNGVLMGMADEFQAVITQALEFGLELPAEMENVVKSMIEMGVATDENGKKLTDLSRFKFTRSLPDAIQDLIDKLDELIDRMGRRLPGAADKVVDEMKRIGTPGPGFAWRTPGDDIAAVEPWGVPSYAKGTAGRYLAADTLAQIHSNEAITPRAAVPALAADIATALRGAVGASGGQRTVTVRAPLFLGTRQIAEAVLPDLLRLIEKNDGGGVESGPLTRVADAVGRKLGVV